MKHTENDASDSRKKTAKERAVIQEKGSKFFRNSKDEVSVFYMNDFKGHGGSAVNGIFIAAGRAETAFAAERNKFKIAAFGTAVHGTAVRGVAAIYHPVYVIHNRRTWMGSIFNFFIMINDDFLQYIHKTIMREK